MFFLIIDEENNFFLDLIRHVYTYTFERDF